MSPSRSGIAYGFGAYALWGLFPLYIKLLDEIGSAEILAHRVVWSLVIVLALLVIGRNLRRLRTLGRRAYGLLALAAVLICINWGVYIWAVNSDQIVETSLGYFINPLVTVLLGVVVFGERLRRLQWVAMGLAAIAVIILTVDYGRPPWIALALAFSFGTYGLVKKKAAVDAVESLAVETAVLFLPALTYLVVLQADGSAAFAEAGWGDTLLLIGCGIVTATPLLLFGAAAVRIPLTTLGTLQYLTPSLQFLLGVAVYGEQVPPVRWVGFALIWLALIVLTAEVLVRRQRRNAVSRRVLETTSAPR
ncbi:EamA family transporter RarD [Jiangella asiatica]|uniref:EamA family transporter RarD n=1 Tax=Jiangella asiatica TaxID=2530372 RepID=A0A4R5CKS3_9ACTN|nr:EamA family transporter RarD [Jiangella asiatica]TDE00929.1 EamA family transporter RarD [Jiangella asiatica]